MFINVLEILSLVTVVCGPLISAAPITERICQSAENRIKIVANLIVAYALMVLLFFALASTGLFRLDIVVLFLGITTLSSLLFFEAIEIIRCSLDAIKNWLQWCAESWFRRIVLLVLAAVMLLTVVGQLLKPHLSWDGLGYHLLFPALWIQEKGFFIKDWPPSLESYAHFPLNMEISAAFLMLPFNGELLVNLLNWPFFILAACALYALTRELKLDRNWSVATVVIVLFSPMLYWEVDSSYVEIALFAFLISSLLFLLRYFQRDSREDCVLFCFSLSMAAGIKIYPATTFLFLMFLLVYVSRLRHAFRIDDLWRKIATNVFLGVVFLILSSFWYIRNYIERGNPLYPFGLSVGSYQLFEMSEYKKRVISRLMRGDSNDDWAAFGEVFSFGPRPNVATGGPKYIVFLFLSLLCLRGFNRSKLWWAQVLMVVLSIGIVGQYFLSGAADLAVMRRNWSPLNARFLLFPLNIVALIAVVQAASILQHRPFVRRVVQLLVFLSIVADLSYVNVTVLSTKVFIVTLMLIVVGALLLALSIRLARLRKVLRASCVSISLLLFLSFCITLLRDYRTATRGQAYAEIRDPTNHRPEFAKGWDYINTQGHLNIALQHGMTATEHDWFFYPLMGERLQNRIFYIPYDDGNDAEKRWIDRLRSFNIDLIVSQHPWAREAVVLENRIDTFQKVLDSEYIKVYRPLYAN